MNSKTQRKLSKSTEHVKAAVEAAQDLVDWFESTDPADWDADVIFAQAKKLEAAGCHARRTLSAIQSDGLITDATPSREDEDWVCDCPYGNSQGITIAECKQSGQHRYGPQEGW